LSGDRERRRRLFFALWPDEQTRKALVRIESSLPRRQGRPIPASNLHITLAFVGAVDAEVHARLSAQAAQIRAEACLLKLNRIGYFARSRILWLGADVCPATLMHLVRQLHAALENCGLRPDVRPYRPHITLLRDVEPAPIKGQIRPIDWQVEKFHLVQSHTRPEGARYEILQGFNLHS
jgi:2'-5' RNA ligase